MNVHSDIEERAFDALAWVEDGFLPRWDFSAWNECLRRRWVWLRVHGATDMARTTEARIFFGLTRLGERELSEWRRRNEEDGD